MDCHPKKGGRTVFLIKSITPEQEQSQKEGHYQGAFKRNSPQEQKAEQAQNNDFQNTAFFPGDSSSGVLSLPDDIISIRQVLIYCFAPAALMARASLWASPSILALDTEHTARRIPFFRGTRNTFCFSRSSQTAWELVTGMVMKKPEM